MVRRLREAGAVLVGKTVTTQYASFDPPPTRNPWNLERTPGGSQQRLRGGGGVRHVPGGARLADGRLDHPAGVLLRRRRAEADVRPGAVSTASCRWRRRWTMSGPMARCVRDLAILFQTIADRWELERTPPHRVSSNPSPSPPSCGWAACSRARATPLMRERFEEVLRRLQAREIPSTNGRCLPAFGPVLERHRTVMAVEAAAFHESRLRRHPEDYDPYIRSLLEEGLATPAPEYARVKEHQQEQRADDALLISSAMGP